jgi:hypothetical protein
MKILCPPGYLVVDGSLWNDHLNAAELIAGGVGTVIIGLYRLNNNSDVLNANSQRLCEQAIAGGLKLHAYCYYYPERDPIKEANWFVDTFQAKGYPILKAWADCEAFKAPMDMNARSEQNRRFSEQLCTRFPRMGVYTAKWYIDAYAPQMNLWLNKYDAWISHYGHQPAEVTRMSWEAFKATWLPNYDVIIAPGQAGKMVGHQFTGDKFILPGLYDLYNQQQPTDVSVFDKDFMDALDSSAPVPTPPPTHEHAYVCQICGQPLPITPVPADPQYKVVGCNFANVRGPGSSGSAPVMYLVKADEILTTDRIDNATRRANIKGTQGWVSLDYLVRV